MKIKLHYTQDYKKHFTLGQLETAKEILLGKLISNEELEDAIKIACGDYDEILKISAEICIDKQTQPFENDVNIYFSIIYKKDYQTFEEVGITLGEIWNISCEYQDYANHGWRRIYKLS